MTIDDEADIQGLKRIGQIVARCLHRMLEEVRPGVTTGELDAIGAKYLEAHGARSAPQSTYGFPGATCISINEEVAHGIPGDRVLREGDLVNIDVSASLDGYFGDTGASVPVGAATPVQERLCEATQKALKAALRQARPGRGLRRVGQAVERVAHQAGFRVIRNLGSHGIGRALHEPPEVIPTCNDPDERRLFHEGMVLTLEPFLTTGRPLVHESDDGWTLLNRPGAWSAQFEHTLIVTRQQPIITTLP